ncbi:MAG: class I tRNA ligase family protein, partial [Bacillota bacterium]
DKYVLIKNNQLIKEVIEAYDEFKFDIVYRKITNFVTFVSSFYLDPAKDVLYIDEANSQNRRNIQTVIYKVLDTLVRVLAPLIPHTTSETYSHIPNIDHLEDVYLLDMPKAEVMSFKNEELMNKFLGLREDVLKALENARNDKIIGKSLKAHIKLYPKPEVKEILEKLDIDFKQAFIVSKLDILDSGFGTYKGTDISIDVLPAEGTTCERCWQVVDEVNDDGICSRCNEVVENL